MIVVSGALAGGYQGAECDPSHLPLCDLTGGYPHHHLVEKREALVHLALAHQGQSLVAQRPQLQGAVMELLSDCQCQFGLLEEPPRIVDVASDERDRVVAALHAWTDALEVMPAPLLPGPSPRAIAEHHAYPGDLGGGADRRQVVTLIEECPVSALQRPAGIHDGA